MTIEIRQMVLKSEINNPEQTSAKHGCDYCEGLSPDLNGSSLDSSAKLREMLERLARLQER